MVLPSSMIFTHVLLLLILNHSQTVASPADSAPSYKFCDLPERSEDYNDFERALVQVFTKNFKFLNSKNLSGIRRFR